MNLLRKLGIVFAGQPCIIGALIGLTVLSAAGYFTAKDPTPINPVVLAQSISEPPKIASPKPAPERTSLPQRLKIPAINVDAPIEPVGLTSDGAMDSPITPSGLAWYKLGPQPGGPGSAVIAGHFGQGASGEGSVFDNLFKLRKGDSLLVEDNAGLTTKFVVRESRNYDPRSDASDVFNSKDGKSHLNLITCEGVWNKASKSYPQRLVVFADKE
jgi:LPXTG-site transpeptidase (sortase) family protein